MKSLLAVWVGLLAWPCARVEGQVLDRIAFQSNRDSDLDSPKEQWNWEIYSMNADGSDQINLTNQSARDIDPAWSPDGSKIAFASDRTGSFKIFVMDADGGNQKQLTRGSGDELWPAWSPDGLQLAYASNEQGGWDLYTMSVDGGDAVNITQSGGADYAPSWSPDGTQIAFISNRDRPSDPYVLLGKFARGGVELVMRPADVFAMDALGGSATNLTLPYEDDTWSPLIPEDTGVYRNASPVWAAAGERIAFLHYWYSSPGRQLTDIMLIDATGGGGEGLGLYRDFWFLGWDMRSVSLSPDMTQLAFSSYTYDTQGDGQEICVVARGGGDPINLTQTPGDDQHPTWSPMSAGHSTHVESATWGVVKSLFQGAAE